MMSYIPLAINLLSIVFIIRVMFVSRFFSLVLKKVSAACDDDINNHRFDWDWRFAEYNKVEFFKPILLFWKPLKVKSFWKDELFITKGVVVSTMLPKILAEQEREDAEARKHENW